MFSDLRNFLAPVWIEASFLVLFAAGFVMLRVDRMLKMKAKRSKMDSFHARKGRRSKADNFPARSRTPIEAEVIPQDGVIVRTRKQIETDMTSGQWRSAVGQWRRVCESGDSSTEIVKFVAHASPETLVVILEDCCRKNDVALARQVHDIATETGVQLLIAAYDALLKVYVVAADLRALPLFTDMRASGLKISEGLCVGLLARAADAKFLRFAQEVVCHAREQGCMTIVVYSALMKVYAYSGLYNKACDLYDNIKADGLEPDAMMYGCLMKFAAECGRTELSRQLSERSPTLDIQNYMSLIRAAGRDKDLARAFAVLHRLKDSGVALDVAAYNCVLDVCVSVKNMQKAEELVQQMNGNCKLDIITYNTLLKGYCNLGDVHRATKLLSEMEAHGLMPNDVSYNCLINAAVSTSNYEQAWETVRMMQHKGVKVDHYTISIMMKAMKKSRYPRQIARALELLDSSKIDVCSDEVLLNTVIETCIWHKHTDRLSSLLVTFENSGLRPCVPTYGTLIKAASSLRRVERCWRFWRQMTEDRAMEPSDIVLGCMLDALVCNDRLEDAENLFHSWKSRVPPNTVMYSTLIKGFANGRQPTRAMEMWHEMRKNGVPMNTVAYNALIDSQARVGAMEEVSGLVAAMEQDGCPPDVITFSTIVKGYSIKGDLMKALDVFRNMDRNGMAADAIIFNTILDGCIRHNNMELADEMVQNMEAFKVVPSNFTLGILVKMHGRRGRLDKAFEVTQTMPARYGFSTNPQVLTCLMCACVNNHAVRKAFDVFDTLKSAKNGADARAYGALLSGCVRHGHLREAASLIEDAYGLGSHKRGLPPGEHLETERVEQFFRGLSQQGLADSLGASLLEQLKTLRVPVGRSYLSSAVGNTRLSNSKRGNLLRNRR